MNIVLGIAAIVSLVLLYQGHEKRITKLENAQTKRVNYRSLEEIEHAMAELAVIEIDTELKMERLESIRNHLSRAHTPK